MRNVMLTVIAFLTLQSAPAIAVDTTAPPTPTISGVDVLGCTRVRVRWSNADDGVPGGDPGTGVAHYTVYRRAGAVVTSLGNVTGGELPHGWAQRRASFTVPNSTFEFGVSATDNEGNTSGTAWSSAVSMPTPVSVICGDTKKPTAPTSVSASLNADACVEATVNWSGGGADFPSFFPFAPASGVKSYRVYRDGRLIAETAASAPKTTGDRFGLAPGRHYRYTVTTVDNANNESLSSPYFDLMSPEECSFVTLNGDAPVWVYGVVFSDQTTPSYSVPDLSAQFVGDAASPGPLRSFFSESSYGRATFHTVSSTGWWVLPHDTAYYCSTVNSSGLGVNCNTSAIFADAYTTSGVTPPAGDVSLVFVQGSIDNRAGVRHVRIPAPTTLPPATGSIGVAAHEFSHLFRAEHSANWNCLAGLPGPDMSDLHFGCGNPLNGGDQYSPLAAGSALRHHPAYTKRVMGFLKADQTRTVTADGEYTLGALEDKTEDFKELRLSARTLADPKFFKPPFYTFEYRTQVGYDGPAGSGGAPFDGLLVRVVPDVSQGIDGNTYFTKKILLAPSSDIFYDAVNDLGLRLLSMDGKTATVRVCGIGSSSCPPDFFD